MESIRPLTVSADCSIGDDFTMYLWDPTNNGNKPVARLLGHQNKVNHVQFSPDGTLIASAGWDNSTVSPSLVVLPHCRKLTHGTCRSCGTPETAGSSRIYVVMLLR